MPTPAQHWMRPLKPGPLRGRHVLLYCQEDKRKGRVLPGVRRAWIFDVAPDGWSASPPIVYASVDQLDSLLDGAVAKKGESTIWLARGWTDLVISGLAELIDSGVIKWRYASINGAKVLIRGSWRGRRITVTSLANWTGNRWDGWHDLERDLGVQRLMTAVINSDMPADSITGAEEVGALQSLAAIVNICTSLGLRRIPPTCSGAGIAAWRGWLGPTASVEKKGGRKKRGAKAAPREVYIGPLPNRPPRAREAERHTCYALTSRQLRKGFVDEPIYCADIRAAYLLGLLNTPLPIMFARTLYKPTAESLAESLIDHTGLALVGIKSPDWCYPCRVNGRVVPCRGTFWTWLCGIDLAGALCRQHVSQVWAAHIWMAAYVDPVRAGHIHSAMGLLDKHENIGLRQAWRSVYSSLIGRFAGWKKIWVDSRAASGFGNWASWAQADPDTGDIVPHRSIAGRAQLLRERVDAGDSVPLLFGVVTAQVRYYTQLLADLAGPENVFAIASDSLWLNAAGWQALLKRVSECGMAPDNLKVKDTYDRAWMTGRSVCVTERHGIRQLHLPGVHDGAFVDASGHVVMEHADDWSAIGTPKSSVGVGRRRVRYSVDKIIDQYAAPAAPLPLGETVNIPLLGGQLLRPLRGGRNIDGQ